MLPISATAAAISLAPTVLASVPKVLSTVTAGADELRKTVPADEPGKAVQGDELREAAQGFEAVFVASLLREALTNEEGKGLLGSGPGSGVLASLLEQTLAEEIARAGGFGIGDRLVQTLSPPDGMTELEGERK